MKKIIKLTTLLFVLVTLTIVSIVATNQKSNKVTATDIDNPTLSVYKKNLSYSSEIYIMYAVEYTGFNPETYPVKMLFYDTVQTEYTKDNATYEVATSGKIVVSDVSCLVFASKGLSAKQMTEDIYARAYVEINGEVIYSKVVKYSVLEYSYELKATGTMTTKLSNLLDAMLEYGACAQINFGYLTDRLANATYYNVNVVGGTLEDGFTQGRFQSIEEIVINAEHLIDDYGFLNWTNSKGEIVSSEETLVINVNSDETFTANYVYLPIEAYFTNEVAYDESINNLDLPETITFDYKEVSKTEKVIWNTSTFVENQIGKQKIYGTLENDEYLVKEISIEISVLPYSFTLNGTINTYTITKYYGTDTHLEVPQTFKEKNITCIGDEAFYECSIEEIVLPETIEEIGFAAFAESNLINIDLQNSLVIIGDSAFENCANLTSITLPVSVTEIGRYTFSDCTNLNDVYYEGTIEDWCYILFSRYAGSNPMDNGNNFYLKNVNDEWEEVTEITIPNSIDEIGYCQFLGFNNLTSITFPIGIITINQKAFEDCENLENVYYMGFESQWNNVDIGSNNTSLLNAQIHFMNIGVVKENGESYFYLGKYPQTVEDDIEITSALDSITTTNELGYIEYNGNEYKKVTAAPRSSNYTFTNGQAVVKDNTYYFKVEPIKWKILKSSDGWYKLLSELILDNTYFYHTYNTTRTINGKTIYPNNYEYSNIRAWLNGYDGTSYDVNNYTNKGFLDIAFTESEKSLINETLVDNSLSSTGNSSNSCICNNTTDKIYLLSYSEAMNTNYGFSSNVSRNIGLSDYARSIGGYMSVDSSYYSNGYWWLRTPKSTDYYGGYSTLRVSYDGDLYQKYSYVNSGNGVCPALEITI